MNMGDAELFLPVLAQEGNWPYILNWIEGGFAINRLIPITPGATDRVSLLHIAADRGDVELARQLLHHGADVSQRTSGFGDTPLHKTATTDCVEMAMLLLHAGAPVNATAGKKYPKGGYTPLHNAAQLAQPKMIAALLANGANPNCPDKWGRTPMHLLAAPGSTNAWTNRIQAAKAFVAYAGNLNLGLKDNDGKTAIEVASGWVKLYPEMRDVVALFRKRIPKWWSISTWLTIWPSKKRHLLSTAHGNRRPNEVPEDTTRKLADPQH